MIDLKNLFKVSFTPSPLNNERIGMTLIELVIVVAILSFLFSLTLVAINPLRQFSQANNTKRKSNILGILNAINEYQKDNSGALPPGIPLGTPVNIANDDPGEADLCSYLIPQYIAKLPTDPASPHNGDPISDCSVLYDTNYTIVREADGGRITLAAPLAEPGETIFVTR